MAGLLAALVFTFGVYYPGLSGSFLLDDYVRLNRLGDLGGVTDFRSFVYYINTAWTGPLGRPLALASFLIDQNTWPAPAADFKYTNTLLHLLNGCLLFALLLRLLRALGLAEREVLGLSLFVTAAWLLHPFLVSTTLYPVQRMTILATTLVFAGLLGHVVAREGFPARPYRALVLMTLALAAAGCVGFLFKETAALIVPLALVLEATLLPRPASNLRLFRHWRTVVLLLPTVALLGYLAWRGIDGFGGFSHRDFGSGERLLTQARLIFQYLFSWFVPQSAYPGLFNQGVEISRGLLTPITTALSLIGVLALAIAAFLLRRRLPLVAAAIGFFLAAHLLESTTIPLELYFEHRNYLPSALLSLPVGAGVLAILRSRRLAIAALILIVLTLVPISYFRASTWGNPGMLAVTALQENPRSQRAHTQAALEFSAAGQRDNAMETLRNGLEVLPDDLILALHLSILECSTGDVASDTLDSLAEAGRSNRYGASQYNMFLRFIETASSGNCDSLTPSRAHALVRQQLSQLPQSESDARHRQLHYFLGLLDLDEARYCDAYNRFSRSAAASPLPGLIARQADRLAREGLYIEALQVIATGSDPERLADRDWRPMRSGIDEMLMRQVRDNIHEAWQNAGRPPIRCAPAAN